MANPDALRDWVHCMVRAMTPEMVGFLAIAFTVWGLGVAFKAINALRTNEPYVFSMWDGGMLRAGKRLNKMGMQIKVVVGVLMAAGCIALLTDLVPRTTASYAVTFVAILSIASDFVTIE